jgi:hypothetical protein
MITQLDLPKVPGFKFKLIFGVLEIENCGSREIGNIDRPKRKLHTNAVKTKEKKCQILQ